MMKKHFVVALCLMMLSQKQPESRAKTDYKRWLQQEVVWIISQRERETFLGLKSDRERDGFIRSFWDRRDPTPDTPRNEYKEEHYRRYEYAIRKFQEGMPGWHTDRGRIYILHGPPVKENFYTSDSRVGADGRTDSSRARTPNTIIWTYHRIANAKYYAGEINLVFQPSTGLSRQSFVLGESGTAQEKADQLARLFGPAADPTFLESDVRYRLVAAGPPAQLNVRGLDIPNSGLGEVTRYMEDLLRSPGEILEENTRLAEERERARQQMRESVMAQLSFGTVPIALATRSFIQEKWDHLVQVEVDVPRSELPKADRFELYCALIDSEGRVADEFVDTVAFPGDAQPVLRYMNSFTVASGDYTIKAAMRAPGGERLGLTQAPLHLDSGPVDGLTTSKLLLAGGVLPSQDSSAAMAGSVVVGDARLIPNRGSNFSARDSLFVYFQILLPDGHKFADADCSVSMSFISGDQIARRLEPRKITEANSVLPGIINFATAVPLEGFTPGDYILQVQVVDHVSRKFSIQRAPFTVR
jgi:GWxTD domain-containing protein